MKCQNLINICSNKIRINFNGRKYLLKKMSSKQELIREKILFKILNNPSSGYRKIAREVGASLATVKRMVVMDDETYCKADFKQLPGKEFYTAIKKGGVSTKFTQTKFGKFPKQYMIWQAICTCGRRSKEVIVKGSINSKTYIEKCLEGPLKDFIQQHNMPVLFWPDLATSHYSKNTIEWYVANNINYVPKDCNPPNCPELRPIEKYWALMKISLKSTKRMCKDERDFQNMWRKSYATVNETSVQNLMKGVKRKVRAFYGNKL